MATIKDVAKASGVSTATVSAVINDTDYVSAELRVRVLAAVRELEYVPSRAARNLRSGKSQLIGLAVADLANPFYARIVCAAEKAVAAWGFSLVIFNSDEKPEVERQIFTRAQTLGCDGLVIVPVGASDSYQRRQFAAKMPVVLLGRSLDMSIDTVTIDNASAGRQVTNYLLDLGHRRIGSITGPMQLSTSRGRLQGMQEAMVTRNLAPLPEHIRSGEFREESAYSVARDMLARPDRPSALYVANGVMAIGVMRAIADLGLRCPQDISIVSTDTIAGLGGISPRLTRTEHPVTEMTDEAIRILIDRIQGTAEQPARNMVFKPSLVVGDSCLPNHKS